MRYLLTIVWFSFALRAHAQLGKQQFNVIDSTRDKLVYTSVVSVPGVTQAVLYQRARTWFAQNFEPSVVTLDDQHTGTLIGRYHSVYTKHFILSRYPIDVWRTLTVSVRDGRYRYELTNFTARNIAQSSAYYRVDVPAVYQEVGPYVSQVAAQELASLLEAMQTVDGRQEKTW